MYSLPGRIKLVVHLVGNDVYTLHEVRKYLVMFSFIRVLGSVSVRCYGTTKSFVLKTYGSHNKITILLN